MANDEKKITDLPPKKADKAADDASRPLAAKDADTVKGGAGATRPGSRGGGFNHNQTLRARRATHS